MGTDPLQSKKGDPVRAQQARAARQKQNHETAKLLNSHVQTRSAIELRTARQIAEITSRRATTQIEASQALADAVKVKSRADTLLARRDADITRKQVGYHPFINSLYQSSSDLKAAKRQKI
jgi:hypothetical protein